MVHLACDAGRRFLLCRVEWRRYRDIIIYRTRAELKAEAQLNHMGYVWWLLEPLLNTVLFYVLLVVVVEQSTVHSISFVLVAAITWQWFNGTVMGTAGSIFDAGGILKQVYLPKIVLPLIAIFTSSWKFFFIFLLLLAWLWCTGSPPSPAYLVLPVLLLLEFAVILAFSLPLAAVIPYFPDARVAIDALLRSLMLVSGVFFPVSLVPAGLRPYFYLNPMAILIENFRRVLIHGQWPEWGMLGYVALFSAASLAFTWWFYARIDKSVVKAINR
jgi:lipopolysaccharide transport system permease protein